MGADDTGLQTRWTTRKKIPLTQARVMHDKLPAGQKRSGLQFEAMPGSVLFSFVPFYYPCLCRFSSYVNLVWDEL